MEKEASIIVYSANDCKACEEAKNFLKLKGIEFKEINVDANEEELNKMVQNTGQMSVPVIQINTEIIVGFDKEKLEKVIGNFYAPTLI